MVGDHRAGGGGGHFHGKVIGMLVVFLRYKILILVFFRVFWILGSAHFPYRVKMINFQQVFSKIGIFQGIASAIWVFLELLNKNPSIFI